MATRDLSQNDYLSIYLGGKDGGVHVPASTAVTSIKRHLIEIRADNTSFSVLTAVDQDGNAVNMLTGVNNYNGVAFDKKEFISAPNGGYISAYTANGITRHFAFPDSNRKQQL